MYITFDELFSLPDMAQAEILAGRESLTNTIKWYHLIEIEEMSDWITTGILVFITGVGLKDSRQGLLNIVDILHRKNAAGLVINQGIYIPEVPDEVIKKADELGLPLIMLPNRVRLLDVTYQVSRLFQEKQMQLKQRDQIIIEMLMSNEPTALDFDHVDGFDSRYLYAVCILSCRTADNQMIDQHAVFNVLNCIRQDKKRYIIAINLHNDYVFMIPFKQSESVGIQVKAVEELAAEIKKDIRCTIFGGIGRAVSQMSELRNSYNEAQRSLHIAHCDIGDKNILHFDELTLFRIVDLNKKAELHSIVQECLGDLINKPELLNTFIVYIQCDRNMKQTADKLYIHVNSVKYRLQQIYDILPSKPVSAFDWNRAWIAVCVYKYLVYTRDFAG